MNQMAPTQPMPISAETRLTVTLTAAAWNVVMAHLDEGPRRVVNAIWNDINAQLSLGAQQIQRADARQTSEEH
jgi:hypothetical protein